MEGADSKSESQDSIEPTPPGAVKFSINNFNISSGESSNSPKQSHGTPSIGVMNAKKRLRAFSIQKKSPLVPAAPITKGTGTGNATVYIGKLAGAKVIPKVEDPNAEQKKPPKLPKPKCSKKLHSESYIEVQRKTLSEIEDMKRKMELVELGIPLGLICPSSNNEKAMPTKAMPPIKSFLDPEKVDEIIREAKKAKAEGKEFKFDYHKLLPGYDNPFQRKKEEQEPQKHIKSESGAVKSKNKQKDHKLDWKYGTYKRIDKKKHRDDREKNEKKKNERKEKLDKHSAHFKKLDKITKETNVDLNDYLVCDSWSLDNDDKNSSSSPKIVQSVKSIPLPDECPRESVGMETPKKTVTVTDSPLSAVSKIEKLQPVKDSFTFEIDPNEDEDILDVFEDESSLDKFSKVTVKKEIYDSPVDEVIELDQSLSKDTSLDGTIDDTFLESVINEIKQEDMSEDEDEKALVEYDVSPKNDKGKARVPVTPELKNYHSSARSDYSDGYRSTESGYKSTESGYRSSKSYQSDADYKSSDNTCQVEKDYKSKKRNKSTKSEGYKATDEFISSKSSYKSKEVGYKSPDIEYKSAERDYKSAGGYNASDGDYKKYASYKPKSSVGSRRLSFLSSGKEFVNDPNLSKATVDSLETWSFVLKICQPLLFRHDRNKCYKETEVLPKLWYTENPKICDCVKDRSVVYEELEMCKMALVDRVYGCDQIQDPPSIKARGWYPRAGHCLTELSTVDATTSDDWEVEETNTSAGHRGPSMTPQRNEEIYLDREYQRFMQAVLSDVSETKQDTPRSTTPVTQDAKKKKKTEEEDDKKKAKKIKLSSEGWSQESDIEEELQKNKKIKLEKDRVRKRKHSVSSLSDSDLDAKRKRKVMKKKENKKVKLKLEKRRRLSKKYLKKLKEREKKNKKFKLEKFDGDSDEDMEKDRKKKSKKRKLQKQKKKNQRKKKSRRKSSSSSSDSSSSSSDSSDSEEERRRRKKKEKKRRKKSTSDSTQSEDLFDVNILKNIKNERLTDDEKEQKLNDFSPRRKPREIINVKELQNDFVGNNIDIKKEVEEITIKPAEVVSPEPNETVISPKNDFKEPQDSNQTIPQIQQPPEESNLSQCSSQDSVISKDRPVYEKDESHLRPSSQNSNYSFNDVISASHQMDDARSAGQQIGDATLVSGQTDMNDSLASETSESRRVSAVKSVNRQSGSDSQISEALTDSKSEVRPCIQTSDVKATDQTSDSLLSNSTSENQIGDVLNSSSIEPEDRSGRRETSDAIGSPLSTTSDSQRTLDVTSGARQISQVISTRRPAADIQTDEHCDVISVVDHGVAVEHAHNLGDVITSPYQKEEDKFNEGYEQESYEMYEQMAMAYQSDVANKISSPPGACSQRIETVVRTRIHGEIKCDWRPGDDRVSANPHRPSRWGLKPGDVNIVLTGHGSDQFVNATPERDNRVYQIQSIANRTDTSSNTGYDEAYMSMYGASDRLQYGDCFATSEIQDERTSENTSKPLLEPRPRSSLDARISHALKTTVLGEVARNDDDDTDAPEKGILVTKSLAINDNMRGAKRVSFADGYKPGQDSDLEEPPKRKKKSRRFGCAWPCPATHPDHVPLWDALPPPPPPPGSPPPPAHLHLIAMHANVPPNMMQPPHPMVGHKFEPGTSLPAFMPPEPPPGLITF